MKSFRKYLKAKMRDPEYKRYYDALKPEFAVIEAIIRKRLANLMLQKVAAALDAKLKISIT